MAVVCSIHHLTKTESQKTWSQSQRTQSTRLETYNPSCTHTHSFTHSRQIERLWLWTGGVNRSNPPEAQGNIKNPAHTSQWQESQPNTRDVRITRKPRGPVDKSSGLFINKYAEVSNFHHFSSC